MNFSDEANFILGKHNQTEEPSLILMNEIEFPILLYIRWAACYNLTLLGCRVQSCSSQRSSSPCASYSYVASE